MKIGRKIYYNKSTGEVVWDKGEMSGSVRDTTFDEDMAVMSEIDSDDIAVMTLEYGEKAEQFRTSGEFTIDHVTKLITFFEPVIPEPIVDELTVLKEENLQLKLEKAELIQQFESKEVQLQSLAISLKIKGEPLEVPNEV
jgi:hypothetical protein